MTFLEILQDVITDLDEDINDTEVVNKVKRYINRGYKELSKREYLEKTKTSTIVNGEVSKPVDMVRLYHVFQDGYPLAYRLNGNKISIDTNGDVQLVYAYIPDPLEGDDDETITNAANDEFIINYAKWLFAKADGLNEDAIYYKGLVDNQRIVIQAKIVKTIDVQGVI